MLLLPVLALLCVALSSTGLERPGVEFKIFQFPPDKIPRIDGHAEDWAIVPEGYVIGMDQLSDTVGGRGTNYQRADLDVRVRVGWVKGINQLYFLYEASDDYWDFGRTDLHNDIFELVVDGDLSGGPFIKHQHPYFKKPEDAHASFHGVHAQNYHIFTPSEGKDWTMVWGCQPWIKELPFANAAQNYQFRPGQSGRYVLEFWITPFDFAPADGPGRAVVSDLKENALIGLSWAVLDYDDEKATSNKAFWNLSHKTTMYGNASDLCAFRLMPLEAALRQPVEAQWSFKIIDPVRRLVAFRDESTGDLKSWKWDFGDGSTSSERHPQHGYEKGGEFTVVLWVEGPAGKSRRAKVWDVVVPGS
ncbi:MAG: PKD domain-containing protein [Verrucomicrobiales bacterium]|nr:PKD domain-containing protein [Verrucomicrobiales bacterium]